MIIVFMWTTQPNLESHVFTTSLSPHAFRHFKLDLSFFGLKIAKSFNSAVQLTWSEPFCAALWWRCCQVTVEWTNYSKGMQYLLVVCRLNSLHRSYGSALCQLHAFLLPQVLEITSSSLQVFPSIQPRELCKMLFQTTGKLLMLE